MDSLPAPGRLMVTRPEADKLWHMAMVRTCSTGEVEMFSIDLQQVEVDTQNNTCEMEYLSSVLPL